MDSVAYCKENCIGCGLCHSELNASMTKNARGFRVPQLNNNKDTIEFLHNVCPTLGYQSSVEKICSTWGNSTGVYGGYARDTEIRKKASSGGALTSLAIYLLESGKVDGVLHVVADEKNPIATRGCLSTTKQQIINGCGSRYSISSPWYDLSELVDSEKKYVAIGKPCDIIALRNLQEKQKRYHNIIYLFSFFCAGLPSERANIELLNKLGCSKEECTELTYRGNGWPGKATAIDMNGKKYEMEYSKAWGGILGRDIHPFCRLCLDGIGEAADISCGDGWYMTEDGKVDFSEKEGRNIIFARTSIGENLLKEAASNGIIMIEPWEDINQLQEIQKYQLTRRTTMKSKLRAYRLMGRKVPSYSKKVLRNLSKSAKIKDKTKIFLGTIKRIIKGSI